MDMLVKHKRRAADRAFWGPFSVRVRHARKIARLSQAELARLLNVGASAVAQWELPKGTSPTVPHLVEIAKACGVAFEWLATGRGPVAIAVEELPAVDPLCFAVDPLEERVLVAFRRVPTRKRETFVRWMEEFF